MPPIEAKQTNVPQTVVYTGVFATIIVLSIVGLIVYYFVEFIERVSIPWHVSQRSEASAGVQSV